MPKITISEEDLTISNELDVTENIVYIPGITKTVAEDKPTVYSTVNEFLNVYGKEPYRFKKDQVIDGEVIVAAGECEKSYMYALELLNAGLKVSFQNVISAVEYGDNDSTLLEDYYKYLEATTEVIGSTIFEDKDNILLHIGLYKKDGTDYIITEGKTKAIRGALANTYSIFGDIEKADPDANLGLPEGYRFAVDFKFPFDKNDIEEITVAVSDGTTNKYGKEALEPDGRLVTVLNIRKISVVTITVKTSQGKHEFIFTFDKANLVAKNAGKAIEPVSSYSIYSEMLDKWTYNIKFLTTAGYPTLVKLGENGTKYDLFQTLVKAAAVRGDTVALVDIPYTQGIYEAFEELNEGIDTTDTSSYMLKGSDKCGLNYTLNEARKDESILKYGTVVGPLGIYEVLNEKVKLEENEYTIKLPGSFGYLLSLVKNIDMLNNPDYFAIAGVTRGLVPHLLALDIDTTGAEADAVQVKTKDYISLNPIVKVQNYGYCIWGNRTLFPNIATKAHRDGDLAASSFLNIRVMAADVKKIIYAACQDLTFETNNLELWLKFKSKIEPTLEQMVANGALERYELTRLANTEKATLSVYVKLVTQYAVEDFDVTVGLTDSTVEAAE